MSLTSLALIALALIVFLIGERPGVSNKPIFELYDGCGDKRPFGSTVENSWLDGRDAAI